VLEEIGQGAYGKSVQAIWRSTIVAAKEVPTAGNENILANELCICVSVGNFT